MMSKFFQKYPRKHWRRHVIVWFVMWPALVSMVGCSSGTSAENVAVTGTVLVNGKPGAYARLQFWPATESDEQLRVFAKANEDGEFSILVPASNLNAPTIDYDVSVSWRIPSNPRDRQDPGYGKELLPKSFQDPKKSGLRVTVDLGAGEVPPIAITF